MSDLLNMIKRIIKVLLVLAAIAAACAGAYYAVTRFLKKPLSRRDEPEDEDEDGDDLSFFREEEPEDEEPESPASENDKESEGKVAEENAEAAGEEAEDTPLKDLEESAVFRWFTRDFLDRRRYLTIPFHRDPVVEEIQ